MGDGDLGNVVISRPFQFVEIQQVVVDREDGADIFTPSLPTALKRIADRYIYAFELGPRDSDRKPMLVAEYYADPDGHLSAVPGVTRRKLEPKAAPKGTAVPAAALPLVRQGTRLRHAFVAMRGRASRAAIMDMEDRLHPVYERMNLADDFYFKLDDTRTAFLPIIDPLTLGEQLNVAYQKALNAAISYTVPFEDNPDKDAVELRARKYQLGKMIKDSLFAPHGGHHDPLGLADHLAGNGGAMLHWLDQHESKLRRLDGQRHYRADQLVRLLNSRIWLDAHGWYLGMKDAAHEVGHCWLDATFCSIDRLSEVPIGRKLIAELVKDMDRGGVLSYLFAPPEERPDLAKHYEEVFPIMRKAATAAVIGFIETAPAVAVYLQTRKANQRIERTLVKLFAHIEVKVGHDLLSGLIVTRTKIELGAELVRISDYKKVKLDLEHWLEDGKPHWPERTRKASAAELIGRLFMGIEMLNFCNAVNKLFGTLGGQPSEPAEKAKASVELFGASLDLVVAAEDPIRAYARELDRMFAKAPEHAAGAASAAEHEAAGLFGKITKPAMFKFLGAASAAIDTVIYWREANEDLHKGDVSMSRAHRLVSLGSGAIFIASFANLAGYATEIAALTAAASIMLVVGVALVAGGFILVAYFSKSSWQKFARHCIFGIEPAAKGEEAWSGGDFAEWRPTVEGIEKQIRVLTSMLCSFKVSGAGLDDHTIFVDLNAVPPNGELELEFSFVYANGQHRKPMYVVDLESGHNKPEGDARFPADVFLTRNGEGAPKRVRVRSEGPPTPSAVKEAHCAVRLRYAPGKGGKPDGGLIPIARPCEYLIRDRSWGMGHMEEIDSLSVGPEEKEHDEHEKEGHHPEEEEIQPGIPM